MCCLEKCQLSIDIVIVVLEISVSSISISISSSCHVVVASSPHQSSRCGV